VLIEITLFWIGAEVMEMIMFIRLLTQNKVIIFLSVILGFCISVALTVTATPLYRSEAQLFVSTPASSIDISALAIGSSFSQQRVKSYAEIINSPMTLEPVIKELSLNVSPEDLSDRISANAPADTVLITISVVDANPELAAKIANVTAAQFGRVASEIEMRNVDVDTPIKVSTVREAIPAGSPFAPKPSVNIVMGLILGFSLGLGIALLKRQLDNTVRDEDDLLGLPLLGAIGFDQSADEKPLITKLGRYAARTEAFRTLRTNIKYIIPSIPAKVIAITSALPGEGKSTTAINLCVSLAQGGSRTILVEADMRRSKVNTYLNMSAHKIGLSGLLSSKKKITPSLIRNSITKFEDKKLDILLAGKIPPNPAELLGSGAMKIIIAQLRQSYDYVIIDCPPVLPITDAAIVSSFVDGAIILIHAGKTKKPEFMGSRAALEAVGARIIGVVLNKIPVDKHGYNYGYRYAYSKSYGKTYGAATKDVYAPSLEDQYRLERDEFFERVAGKRFKEELRRESGKYDL
jgi:succinoglycan biosynthesis transport protein ExoP